MAALASVMYPSTLYSPAGSSSPMFIVTSTVCPAPALIAVVALPYSFEPLSGLNEVLSTMSASAPLENATVTVIESAVVLSSAGCSVIAITSAMAVDVGVVVALVVGLVVWLDVTELVAVEVGDEVAVEVGLVVPDVVPVEVGLVVPDVVPVVVSRITMLALTAELSRLLQVGALAPRYVMPLFDLRAFATLYSPRDAARALDCFVADGYKALYR